jgi:DNA-directed DNA polymerase III PolC
VAFEKACRAAAIQPILGMTATISPPPEEAGAGLVQSPGQLLLLATGPSGYQSLCRLSSAIQGRQDRLEAANRGLSWDSLKEHARGLLCLSGGRRGWLDRALRAGNGPAASRYVARLGGIFGDNAYLSLEIHQPEDFETAGEIMALSRRFGLPPAAVQPVYCLDPSHRSRLRLLRAIKDNRRLDEVDDIGAGPAGPIDLHWLHPTEVAQRFSAFPEAVEQVSQIASRCRPALPDGRLVWPVPRLPEGMPEGASSGNLDQILAEQALAGLSTRYGPDIPAEVRLRLGTELEAIAHSGFAPQFLVVADIVRFARRTGVPVGTRGSVANSLVAYCMDITTVDPIANELLFERFLNPARSSPPDIDLDFCSRRRDEVLTYVRETYGHDRVAMVATISTMRPKSAVRETGKAYGLDDKTISQLARRLPRDWHPDPRRRGTRSINDLLEELEEPEQRQVIRAAADVVGQPHHLSIHPGGVVITPGPLTDYVPVQWAPKGFLITQFDHQDLEVLGLLKLDLLGIRALTVLTDAAELVRLHHDPAFSLETIPLDDERTGDLLARGETIGVFQCESAGAQRTLRQLAARSIFDLAVANAFFKPGPATGGMAQTFIRRYRGEEAVGYLHPALEPILASTQGVLLFQEQILRVATEIAGLNWEQADHLRRGMSKFQVKEMEAMQAQFTAGCQRTAPDGPAFTEEQAQTLWQQVLAFAGYGFNRGHATAYADVSYRSAYIKTHWPAEFLCARLAEWGGFHHPAIYSAEALRLGMSIQPPHINHSHRAFTLTYHPQPPAPSPQSPILWMGLGQVRDLKRSSIRAIIAGRENRSFAGLQDLMERVALGKKEVDHLIRCGALDGLGDSRASILAEAALIRQAGSARQMAFTFASPEVDPETPAERLAWEQRILGRPVSIHPLGLIKEKLGQTTPLAALPESKGRPVTVAGVRLPGWTGGPGFFLGDGGSFVIVKGDRSMKAPEPWIPLRLRGRWQRDEWGTGWFQATFLGHLSR